MSFSIICSENGEDVNLVTVKYDMGWQKRGSGRKYDSKSGVGTLIGEQTGKVVEHDLCNKKWCSYKRNPDKYRSTVSLTNLPLRKKLAEIIGEYTSGDNIEKISPCASTKEVESFHSMVANRAPKAKHLCSSSSLERRVDCTVAQKNISYGFISQVYEECGLSPGKITEKLSEKLAIKRKYQNDYKNSLVNKRRKLFRKQIIKEKETVVEMREGDTYNNLLI
ncbi:unnamed protein product [Mytilus coruscus]|uniref:Mutator-like transposase domain-containing protein n=1 Tax=Mytilus coruscus TaxID=42192 RepID=A0A6J8C8J6_MYTCO|nr:unnamed protein product [Mytilus coruscus]